jgi:hypothetical protein
MVIEGVPDDKTIESGDPEVGAALIIRLVAVDTKRR